jgi:Family of unknown function (DUF6191)
VSIFFDLFSPGQRHRVDEQERLEHTREVEGLGEPGRGPVDLNSGVVLIKASPAPQGEGAARTAAGNETAETAGDSDDETPDSAPRRP